jgi:phytoene dehydrogenase-like protein
MKEKNVVVVGGGVAGLACATLVAQTGARVQLYEKAEQLGGRARTRRLGEFHLNRGAHALYQGGPGDRVLRRLGVPWTGGAPPLADAWVESDGSRHRTPTSAGSMFQTTLLTAAEKLELAAAMGTAAIGPLGSARGMSVRQWTHRAARAPRVRALLETLLRLSTYAHAPTTQSAGAALAQLRRALFKDVIYLDQGWQTLVDGLRDKALTAGVELHLGCAVSGLVMDAQRCTGLRFRDGSTLRADAVVLAVPPATAATLAGGSVAQELDGYRAKHPPVLAACLDVGLRDLPKPGVLNVLSLDAPLYLSVHSASARLAPSGGALVHCIRYIGPGEEIDNDELRRELEDLLERSQPGWRDHIAHVQWLPRMQAASCLDLASDSGARPAVQSATPGLFLAGDWVGETGVLADAAFASAEAAADAIDAVRAGRETA